MYVEIVAYSSPNCPSIQISSCDHKFQEKASPCIDKKHIKIEAEPSPTSLKEIA